MIVRPTWTGGSATPIRPPPTTSLCGLAQLAAADGGDDVDAAKVLAWVLLPAACRVAGSFARVADIDEHVAAQLWIEVRSFSWQTTSKVAANIAGRLRKHLATDLSDLPSAEAPPDLAGRHRGGGLALARQYGVGGPDDGPSPMDELLSVLEWGCRRGLITSEDRLLLLDVIAAAADDPAWHRSGAALLGDKVSDSVGTHWGISGRTVRRRAAASDQRAGPGRRRPEAGGHRMTVRNPRPRWLTAVDTKGGGSSND